MDARDINGQQVPRKVPEARELVRLRRQLQADSRVETWK